ncbi:MAG: hypothetical protein HRF48_14585 [Chloroflexota bacterium]
MTITSIVRPQAAAFTEPDGPDTAPVHILHRRHDGFIAFCGRDEKGRFCDYAALPAADLDGAFGRCREHLRVNGFYSVNGFYRAGHGQSRHVPGLPAPLRQGRALRWLTACYADLDGYRLGYTPGELVGLLVDAQDQGAIPPASMLVRSGRGVWAFWILRNHDPRDPMDGPVRAWPESVTAYRRIQRELHRRLAPWGADAQARDAARVTRVPGSIHMPSGRRVAYWGQADASGNPFTYTLGELCGWFGVPAAGPYGLDRPEPDPKRRALGVLGRRALIDRRLRQFEALRAMRGGFQQGCRARACWLLACWLTQAGVDQATTAAMVHELAAECRPPLPAQEADAALRSRHDLHRIRDQTIADYLLITPDESHALDGWPCASMYGADEPPRLTRRERRQVRHQAIAHLVGNAASPPPLRALRDRLARYGIRCSVETLRNDLRDLGLMKRPPVCTYNPDEIAVVKPNWANLNTSTN